MLERSPNIINKFNRISTTNQDLIFLNVKFIRPFTNFRVVLGTRIKKIEITIINYLYISIYVLNEYDNNNYISNYLFNI